MSPATAPRAEAQLRFLSPPPGLEPSVDFTLAQIDTTPGLFSLTSTGGARLFVLDTALHLPAYTPHLPPAAVAALDCGAEAPQILVVVTPSARSTVNLAAPILLNGVTGACLQVILDGNEWPLRHPLSPV